MDKLNLRELLRYGYSGLLCVTVAVLVDGSAVGEYVSQLGPVLAPLVVLALGTLVYLVFKAMVGDFFLWRLIDWSHPRVENLLGHCGTRCKVRYLETHFGVERGQGLAAWALVRDTLLSTHARESFHVQHSEGYLLYMTAFVCAPVSLFGFAHVAPVPHTVRMSLAMTALVAFAAAWRHDLVLCRRERAVLGALPESEMRRVLIAGGFLTGVVSEIQSQHRLPA